MLLLLLLLLLVSATSVLGPIFRPPSQSPHPRLDHARPFLILLRTHRLSPWCELLLLLVVLVAVVPLVLVFLTCKQGRVPPAASLLLGMRLVGKQDL